MTETTSTKVAAIAARGLANPESLSPAEVRSICGSALTQTECNAHERGLAIAAAEAASDDKLLVIAKRIVEWVRAVDDETDDLEYLNSGEGWDDIHETAEMAKRAIASIEQAERM